MCTLFKVIVFVLDNKKPQEWTIGHIFWFSSGNNRAHIEFISFEVERHIHVKKVRNRYFIL